MNYSKCEVVGRTDVARDLFVSHDVSLPETSRSTVVLLGTPLSVDKQLDEVLQGKIQQLCVDEETGVDAVACLSVPSA